MLLFIYSGIKNPFEFESFFQFSNGRRCSCCQTSLSLIEHEARQAILQSNTFLFSPCCSSRVLLSMINSIHAMQHMFLWACVSVCWHVPEAQKWSAHSLLCSLTAGKTSVLHHSCMVMLCSFIFNEYFPWIMQKEKRKGMFLWKG